MDCTAWQFWTMRQSNGCSTPAPRSSAANSGYEELTQKMKSFQRQKPHGLLGFWSKLRWMCCKISHNCDRGTLSTVGWRYEGLWIQYPKKKKAGFQRRNK